jgi:hypothetical protein
MPRNEMEKQRSELIARLQKAPASSPGANPLYRKARLLLTTKWMRTPVVHRVGLLKTALWLISVADHYPVI